MKNIKYVIGIVIFFMVCNLKCENTLQKNWQERKELLLKDPSVVHYYTFEDIIDSESIVKDLSGKGGNLKFVSMKDGVTNVGKMTVIEGRFPNKKAVRCDMGYYQGPAVEIETNTFTAECWFRISGPTQKYDGIKERVITLLLSGGGARGWILKCNSARISASQKTPSGEDTYRYFEAQVKNTTITKGVWQHATMTWDGDEVLFYLNGEIVAKRKFEGVYNPAKLPFKVGYSTLEILDLDEVVIHNRVLTPEEINKAGGVEKNMLDESLSRSDTLIKKKDFDGARKEYEKIKSIQGIDYGQTLALFNIAESYQLERKYELADKIYTEILEIPSLNTYYKAYTLFARAKLYNKQGKYSQERNTYGLIAKLADVSENDLMRANIGIGDTYRYEKKYTKAHQVFEELIAEVSSKYNPNEVHRLKLIDRLEAIDGLADGQIEISEREKRIGLINMPKYEIYVSVSGNDTGKGTKDEPFGTIKRAQEEVRRIKKEKGLPSGGINVYLMKGEYYIDDTVLFTQEDSGTEEAPVIYRSLPGETVRLIGGKKITNFKPLKDPEITKRLPSESRGKVWVADLKEVGITEYGTLKNRGRGPAQPGAMELIYNGKAMQMARWPNEGWLRVASLVDPKGDYTFRERPYQKGKFKYSGNRPERWIEEKDAWARGYLGPEVPYVIKHLKITSIDTDNKIIYLADDPRHKHLKDPAYEGNRISKSTPYFVYNLLSEVDIPEEFYLDRESGKLYFLPPDDMKGEAIVTTLDKPILQYKNASNIIFYKVTMEGTWRDAILISGGERNLIAGCVVRNTGQNGIYLTDGWNHGIVGCDIYDVGEGAIMLHDYALPVENRRRLIPNGFYAENNFISRLNRLSGSSAAIDIRGIGQRVSHNIITDSNYLAINFVCNNHVIEYNEIHDVLAHARELGAIYTWDLGQPATYRGNIIKNNFLHHITGHYSPNSLYAVDAIHLDGLSSNLTISGNLLYRTTGIGSSSPDSRFENNIFVNCFPGLSLRNRSSLIEKDGELSKHGYSLFKVFKQFGYNTPPWSVRYPQLSDIFSPEKRPLGWPRNITVERNISFGGLFANITTDVRADNIVSGNIGNQDPLFYNLNNLDFRIRPGSPIYGKNGFEPLEFEKIGLYNDQLRASWPVQRQIGKYFDQSKEDKKIGKTKDYRVEKRVTPIKIDGNLDKNEWLGLDKKRAIVIDKYYTKAQEEAKCKSYVWMLYDDKYLYIGVENEPDPYTKGMPETVKNIPITWGMIEVSVEGRVTDEADSWWLTDMETGPIYIFTGYPNGELAVFDSYFKVPDSLKNKLIHKSEYASLMRDIDTYSWSAEFKIPLDTINIDPKEIENTKFNIGIRKRKNWIGWVFTGERIWRLEDGGKIIFSK